MVRCLENNQCLSVALGELFEECNHLESVFINGKTVHLKKYLGGGDLKFLNQVTGIASFSSLYSCLWCKCHRESRFEMTYPEQGARTLEEISNFAKKKKLWCVSQSKPLFKSVPVTNIVPDTLHLFLRIANQTVYQVIKYLQDKDNFVILSANELKKCVNLQRFKDMFNQLAFKIGNFS